MSDDPTEAASTWYFNWLYDLEATAISDVESMNLTESALLECEHALNDEVFVSTVTLSTLVLGVVFILFIIRKILKAPQIWSQMVKDAFNDIDLDKNGKLNEAELYAAVLEIYAAKLPLRILPPKKQDVLELLQRLDTDDSGGDRIELDIDEFDEAMVTLGAQVSIRLAMLIAFMAFTPVLSAILYQAGASHPEFTSIFPDWIHCLAGMVEEALGVRTLITLVLLSLSKKALFIVELILMPILSCLLPQQPKKKSVGKGRVSELH
jgi:hypothetical protein